MKPVRTEETNFTYKLPGGTEANDLPCVVRPDPHGLLKHKDGDTTSFWQPEDDEDLDRARAVYVHVQQTGLLAAEVGFGDTTDEAKLAAYPLQPSHLGGDLVFPLSDEHKKWLGNGGHFVLRIEGHPTPPVRLWLG